MPVPAAPAVVAPRPEYPVVAPAWAAALRLVRFDGHVIPLAAGATSLNRRDVNPSDLEMSRQHAQVTQQGGYYWLQDLGSANGTFVNEVRIFSPVVLSPGDQVRLGRTVLRVEA